MLPLVREQAASHKRRAGWFEFSDMLALVAKALADGVTKLAGPAPEKEASLLAAWKREGARK